MSLHFVFNSFKPTQVTVNNSFMYEILKCSWVIFKAFFSKYFNIIIRGDLCVTWEWRMCHQSCLLPGCSLRKWISASKRPKKRSVNYVKIHGLQIVLLHVTLMCLQQCYGHLRLLERVFAACSDGRRSSVVTLCCCSGDIVCLIHGTETQRNEPWFLL